MVHIIEPDVLAQNPLTWNSILKTNRIPCSRGYRTIATRHNTSTSSILVVGWECSFVCCSRHKITSKLAFAVVTMKPFFAGIFQWNSHTLSLVLPCRFQPQIVFQEVPSSCWKESTAAARRLSAACCWSTSHRHSPCPPQQCAFRTVLRPSVSWLMHIFNQEKIWKIEPSIYSFRPTDGKRSNPWPITLRPEERLFVTATHIRELHFRRPKMQMTPWLSSGANRPTRDSLLQMRSYFWPCHKTRQRREEGKIS